VVQPPRRNHEDKLLRYLKGNPVKVGEGLGRTILQLNRKGNSFKKRVERFLEVLPTSFETEDFIVVHSAVSHDKAITLMDRTQEWRKSFTGKKVVFHGHIRVEKPEVFINDNFHKIINLDTACYTGGSLTGIHYPSMKFKQVRAHKVYYEKRNEAN
jgi:protein phosphatase